MSTPFGAGLDSVSLDSNLRTNTRRRTVVTEKRSNVDIVSEGVSGAGDDRVAEGRDLSHSIRGETVIDRHKDLPQLKRALINSTISPRKRKPVVKPERPKWKTVISILAKNLVLLFVLVLLGRMIWKSFEKSERGKILSAGIMDFESRMSEVEQFLKTTAKMMQVQVEAVDRKYDGELGNLRREITKIYDEQNLLLENELKKLGARADNLDKSLAEIRDTGFFSKEDFDKFLSELKKSEGPEAGSLELSLDEVRAYARDIVQKQIEKHAADGLARVDYALASGGAKVLQHSEPFFHGRFSSWFYGDKARNWVHESAKKMLEPSFGEPGQCFALKGSTGFVEIRLRASIIPEAVTLEHVAKSVAYDRSSAPKHCRISGWLQGPGDVSAERFLLVEFTYDLEKSNAQTFNIAAGGGILVNVVRLDFTSNHGSPLHTCIYRLRVHGYEPKSVTSLPGRSA